MNRRPAHDALQVALAAVAVAAVVSPPVAVGVVAAVGVDPAAATLATAGVAVLGGVAASGVLGLDHPDRIHGGIAPAVLLGVPTLYGVVAVGTGLTPGGSPWTVPFGASAVCGVVAAAAALRVAGGRAARRANAESDRRVEWRARTADRPGWWVRLLGLAGGGVGVVLGAVLLAAGWGVPGAVTALAGAVGTWRVYVVGRPRSYAALDGGLVVAGRLRPWSAFEGHEVTDDAVVVHARRGWREDVRFDRGDLTDEDAVVGALARHLPDRGRVESAPGGEEASPEKSPGS